MTDFILTTNDQAIFDEPPAEFGLTIVIAPPGILQGSGNATINGKTICVEGDEKKIIVPCTYTTSVYTIPGNGELSIKTLAPNQKAIRARSNGRHLLLKGDTFSAQLQVLRPAMEPTEPIPTPDTTLQYSGTGFFNTTNRTTKAT